ncbi:MAG: 50S ribosomal protein L11 methyltransferase [Deltaproteobacteria bacterium]|jgi:ribosomal protein L11 methyltransferase|nr:50S ribosomal protein L11 methyltransferase [Deltaproteobacteria bacterium]
MDDWLLVSLSVPPAAGEAASEALFSVGAGGVWEEKPDEDGRLVFKSGFDQDEEMRLMAVLPAYLYRIAEAMELPLTDFALTMELKPGEDYSETWKQDLKPVRVDSSLIVCPSFWTDDLEADENAKVLKLDPGSAFGSGHHPSTFMCLKLLAHLVQNGYLPNDVLDLGAGSGILALSAALLLPEAGIELLDDDPETEFAVAENIALNGLSHRLSPRIGSLNDLDGQFDLIMANLTRNALLELSRPIGERSRLPGRLILSGILADQAPDVLKCFAQLGFYPVRHLGQVEWSALSLVRGLEGEPAPSRILLDPKSGQEIEMF